MDGVGGRVFGEKVSLRTTSQLRWDVVKNTNTKTDCTTLTDQCGPHLVDSAQADYCYI
jgi:hypothetical protein